VAILAAVRLSQSHTRKIVTAKIIEQKAAAAIVVAVECTTVTVVLIAIECRKFRAMVWKQQR